MKKTPYCDKHEFNAELREFKKTTVLSEKLGKIFLNIAEHYIKYNHRFIKYATEHEDFIGDAVARMVSQAHKFNPEHPKANAFAYFTTIAHRTTLCTIKKNIRRWEFQHQLTISTLKELNTNNLFVGQILDSPEEN
jgi:DNA-directed RNA polymerase specialized sigma24 family protein